MSAPTIIPPITDPMGKHWRQPPVSAIALDATHALMTRETFEALGEYSTSHPSGVYPGKMWRRHDGAHDPRCKPADRRWLLVWFSDSDLRDRCTVNWREILLA